MSAVVRVIWGLAPCGAIRTTQSEDKDMMCRTGSHGISGVWARIAPSLRRAQYTGDDNFNWRRFGNTKTTSVCTLYHNGPVPHWLTYPYPCWRLCG